MREQRRGGDESDRAHRAVGRRDGRRIRHAEPPAQDKEGPERHRDHGEQRHAEHSDDVRIEAAPVQLHAAFEADGEEQMDREDFGNRLRNFQIRAQPDREHPEEEKQDGWIGEIGEEQRGVHASADVEL